MELVVTEKDNAARRIADILSDGSASGDRRNGVNVYRWGDTRCVGLSGHVVGVDFPPEYEDWRDVEPVELVEADVVKRPTRENIVRTLRSLAREADAAVIATDYDREGELIGKEAHELIREVTDVPIRRVRFSSITDREVREAFAEPDDLDFDLAAAGEARQVIDLLWGASLTRFLSLTAGQLGEDFISVGRVQSPTLKLIVDREREIQAFEPEDYWELFADLDKDGETFEAQYFHEDDGTETERLWDGERAEAVHEVLAGADVATVTSVTRRTRTDEPPAPFNTTQFISAAGSLGFAAGRAMSIAEELYTAGYVTYPRTDNTVYPEDLDPEALLERFTEHSAFAEDAASLLDGGSIEPTRGDEETTDHPPIHPTGELPDRGDLADDEWRLYELVVRRFLATCAPAATWAHVKVVADADGASLKANGKRLVEAGYHAVYPYLSTSENYVPEVAEGEALDVTEVRLEDKQTQPPRRRGQSRLIETMEDLGIGTKCLPGDEKVLVRTATEDVERRRVEELFSEERVAIADGDTDVATTDEGPTTLSYEETEGRVVETESKFVSRRSLRSDESVLRIDTDTGSFSVTEDHPLYVLDGDRPGTIRASDVSPGDKLLSTRRHISAGEALSSAVLTWPEFASKCDWSSKLYGSDCNDALADARSAAGETQSEFANRLGTDRSYLSHYENDRRDVPAWILGEAGIRPDELHGLNYNTTIENPFPLEWSAEVARVLGNLLGDGSIHVNEEENVVDVRYHNTDTRLIDRFADDIETLFGVSPTVSERPGRDDHHRTKYQVNVSSAVARVLVTLLDTVSSDGCPDVPVELVPAFVGALFDDEGHVSRDRKGFISNTDHDLLAGVGTMLAELGIETKLAPDQHKLHIRGRANLERFLDEIPIASDEKFYRAMDGLREYDVTRYKAEILQLTDESPMTSGELAGTVGLSRGRITDLVRVLREQGYIDKEIAGSNRANDHNREIRYVATDVEESVYSRVLGHPSTVTVLNVTEREYDGPVYDLSVDDVAPNFALEGGIIVHNSTRHNTLEKLYDRGYLEGDPPRPTRLAMAVVDAAESFADRIVDEEMTRQLEADMTAIAEGEVEFEEVTAESREMLAAIFEELHEDREEIREHLRESLKADRRLGPCPDCGEDLLVRKSRRGSYFVGCDGFPDCEYTLPLPNRGEPTVLEEVCEDHDLQHVKMLAGRSTFVHGCPRCEAEAADETEDRVIGACPECGDRAASETPRDGGGEAAGTDGGELAIKQLRNGSRLAGCTRYPDCDYSLPLPRRGDIEVTDERCEEHDLPALVVTEGEDDDDPWELGCPVCNYAEYRERQRLSELEDLDGLGPATADKLADAGVEDLEDLADADPDAVAEAVQGVTADGVREWQEQVAAEREEAATAAS